MDTMFPTDGPADGAAQASSRRICCHRSSVSAAGVRGISGAGARRDRRWRRRLQPAASGTPICSLAPGHRQNFDGAHSGQSPELRARSDATPCNECDICRSITAGDDMDVLEIDGASNRGIDEIRQLRQNVNVRPSRSRFKIYIIDEVHMLTKAAFNALLENAGRAAGACEVHFLHDRAGKNSDHDPLALPAVRFCGYSNQANRRAAASKLSDSERVAGRAGGVGDSRPARGRFNARQPIACWSN